MVSPEMVSPEATHRSGTDKGTPSSVGRQAVNKLLGQLHAPVISSRRSSRRIGRLRLVENGASQAVVKACA
jgi:hypothetical protein